MTKQSVAKNMNIGMGGMGVSLGNIALEQCHCATGVPAGFVLILRVRWTAPFSELQVQFENLSSF